MIDLKYDELLTIEQARQWLGERTGHPPAKAAIYRWVNVGIKGVKLDTARIGGSLYTSVEALERFANRHNEPPAPPVVPLSKRRQRENEEASRLAREIFG